MSVGPSAVVDTPVISRGDNLEQLRKAAGRVDVDLSYIHPPLNSEPQLRTWHASQGAVPLGP